jgi:eukaryotic-like serine/threonine-protein kinase
MAKEKHWDDKWTIIDKLSEGGQGVTYLVKRKGDESEKNRFVLKELKQKKQNERRQRMYSEAKILEILKGYSGVPTLIDSNVEKWLSKEPLYIVTELIDGKTLGETVNDRPLGLAEAITLTIKLLDVVQYCNDKKIIHRDIKPDNIMVRDESGDPVLIDFGISFTQVEASGDPLTLTLQQLGNRFLRLPELLDRDADGKRDVRSDITQCCGILYYILIGLYPIQLQNAKGQKPHEIPEFKKYLSDLDRSTPQTKVILNEIFDRAFEIDIDNRWQSIKKLQDILMKLKNRERYNAWLRKLTIRPRSIARELIFFSGIWR